MSRRPVVTLATPAQEPNFRKMLAQGRNMRELSAAELKERIPALRPGYAAAAAIEDDTFEMDVAALLQGFLRQLRASGGVLALRSRAGRIERRAGEWHVEVSGGDVFSAPIVVDAAGAWGDEVAALAGVAPLGLQPKRRTALIIDPAPWKVADWPAMSDAVTSWYAKPEARSKLLVSPAEETDMPPHECGAEDLDVAIAVDRMQQALDIEVKRVEHSWAGLRSFTPDRSLAIGWDSKVEGFFWSVGQGGYGIQTSPAQGQTRRGLDRRARSRRGAELREARRSRALFPRREERERGASHSEGMNPLPARPREDGFRSARPSPGPFGP